MAVLTIAADAGALAVEAAERLTRMMEASMAARGSAIISLTGGTTPQQAYRLLGDPAHPWRGRIDWGRVHLFWGDERHVAPEHPDSNFTLADDALIRRVPIPAAQVHRMRAELADATEVARAYEAALTRGFAAAGRTDATFDIMLLGLGEDGHIASVFPGSELLREDAPPLPRVAAVWAEHLRAWRITLTPPALLDARAIVMLVAGSAKADAVRAALELPVDVQRWPVQLLRAAGDRVQWMVDRASAARLTSGGSLP